MWLGTSIPLGSRENSRQVVRWMLGPLTTTELIRMTQITRNLVRTTLGFFAGAVSLASLFVACIVVAVLRAKTSHGTPTTEDYWFGLALLGALTLGFSSVLTFFARTASAVVPTRITSIAGAGAVTLLLVSMMLIGEPLGMRGSIAVALAAGALAALTMGARHVARNQLGRAELSEPSA
jgi:drug/metabolite transporter (DMT)-like permease